MYILSEPLDWRLLR